MYFEKSTLYFRSSNGHNDVAWYLYSPINQKPKGIVQISHGMCEYLERYEDFIGFLCKEGYIVCGNDHIGHGRSVNSPDELGFFAEKNGWRYLVKDVLTLTAIMQQRYPSIPYFLLGHSMGSLIERTILAKYSDLYDGALIIGTLSISFGLDAVLALIESIGKTKGLHYRSKLLDRMMFGMSNIKIDEPETQYDWICSDMEVVREFAANPSCTFIFTDRGMYDLVMLVKYVSEKGWAEKISTELPIFVAGGAEDPIGQYGRYTREVFTKLVKAGVQDAELHIYPEMRHEILNEKGKIEVYRDILCWLNSNIAN